MAAKHAALETWWHTYDDTDRARARALVERMGCGHLADRAVATASDGERQRIQLARTLMVEPDLLLLDEPTAGLDLGGREALVARLADLAAAPDAPPTVLVTHHTEEIPPGFTHALLLRAGRVLAAGPLDETLTAEALSACFATAVSLERRAGRFIALAAPRPPAPLAYPPAPRQATVQELHGPTVADPTALSDADTVTLDGWLPSPDGSLLAYLLSDAGDEESSLRVMAVDTGEPVDGPIDRCRYSALAWAGEWGVSPRQRRREPPE